MMKYKGLRKSRCVIKPPDSVRLIDRFGHGERLTEIKKKARSGLLLNIELSGFLDAHYVDEFLHSCCAFVQSGPFLIRKVDLNDLFDAVLA